MLSSKLDYYGIKDTALNWFKRYLTNRTQYVDCNGILSSISEIETGVPQGSIIGRLLFIVYMNDIHRVSTNLNLILYADDTTPSSPICSFTRGYDDNIDIFSTLTNSELNKTADWLAVNKLSVNVLKTSWQKVPDISLPSAGCNGKRHSMHYDKQHPNWAFFPSLFFLD